MVRKESPKTIHGKVRINLGGIALGGGSSAKRNSWRAAWAYGRRALVSVFSPLWRVHRVSGPLGGLLWVGLSAFVGFLTKSPGWGLVVLLSAVLVLALWDIVKREVQAEGRVSAEVKLLSHWLDYGNLVLMSLDTGYIFVKSARDNESVERGYEIAKKDRERAVKWVRDAEENIQNELGEQVVLLFRAHPNVTLSKSPPSDLPDYAHELWQDIACRLEWLAVRLAGLLEAQRRRTA